MRTILLALCLTACTASKPQPQPADVAYDSAPSCYDQSESCRDAWFIYGDATGDYGPIDAAE